MKVSAIILMLSLFVLRSEAQTIETLTDSRDSKSYKIVRIGDQWWMAQNLNYTTREGSWCYFSDNDNCDIYGRLYEWETALEVCPSGWHLPSDEEWDNLLEYLNGDSIAGGKLKAIDTNTWQNPNVADNSSGFSALPGGYRIYDGMYRHVEETAYFWTSTPFNKKKAWFRYLYNFDAGVGHLYFNKGYAFSVRCIKDKY